MSNDSDMDYSDDNDNEDYYSPEGLDDLNDEQGQGHWKKSPEDFEYTCLSLEEVEKLLNESVEQLSNELQLIPYLAKILLHEHKWTVRDIVNKYHSNASSLLIEARIKPSMNYVSTAYKHTECSVCYATPDASRFQSLSCGHSFCRDCWATYFECQISQGISTAIGCMASKCDVRAPEDMVLTLITRPMLREKYQQFAFRDFVKSHPELRFCPGPNCQMVARAIELSPKKVICTGCQFSFCFVCGNDYHAPTDCQTIQRWLTKCADDSETANYISANTKDCPKCHTCIEKNGGCNHMQCSECKYDFCWMCLTEWKEHGSEYYECSRYKDNPRIAAESLQTQAREALKKYLHYFERWENHSKSLQLEQRTRERIDERLHKGVGTWVEWQFLIDASAQLAKCRYTLQYTYPYAYFMESGSRKTLFEYQQGKLEAEIENLSWKIERAETTDHGDVKNQMYIAEKWRMTLLKEFFPSGSPSSSSSSGNAAGSSSSSSYPTVGNL